MLIVSVNIVFVPFLIPAISIYMLFFFFFVLLLSYFYFSIAVAKALLPLFNLSNLKFYRVITSFFFSLSDTLSTQGFALSFTHWYVILYTCISRLTFIVISFFASFTLCYFYFFVLSDRFGDGRATSVTSLSKYTRLFLLSFFVKLTGNL